ncbi:serine/threonine-protein kinase [Limnoglobus roseus]|uniref:Serine/threonine protein kinase n=1 Tax=Limnoglobus roseus TaxID=2598579 RepID=A0A5C1AD77_9BACT|nr:serine/threonine-protein kinase [Limnoglobus roseus]QEL17309.1 serine/threonine protein kinase [Limnoglobus roseus]
MTHYFVSANLWFTAGLILIFGLGPSAKSHSYEGIYGYGTFNTLAAYGGVLALFVAALWNLAQWRRTRTTPQNSAVLFVGANVWFGAGLILLLSLGPSQNSHSYESIFGYGKINSLPAYFGVFAVFAAAFWNFRQWRKTRTDQPAVRPSGVSVPYPPPGKRVTWPPFALAGAILVGGLLLMFVQTSVQTIQPPTMVAPATRVAVQSIGQPTPTRHFEADDGQQWAVEHPQPTPVTAPPAAVRTSAGLMVLPIFFVFLAVFFAVIALQRAKVDRKQPDRVMGEDGWMPFQKRRVAAAVPIVCTIIGVVFGQLVLRDIRNELYDRALLILLLFAAGAVGLSLRLNRWAYSESVAEQVVPPPPPPSAGTAPPPVARTCPKCHAVLAADAPQGLCPRCLMAGAFQSILNPSRTGAYGGAVEPPTPEEVQEHFPNLEIVGLLGQGGMGAVYQARQPNLDRTVALKLIRPREDNPMFAERFVREAKAMAKLSHPNIVHIHESGEAGGSLFLIMEFVDGVTLREAIRAKAIPPAEALKIVGQLCDALEYAHGQGVVHRDIKPENILLDRAGRVKVVDFGLAKLATDNAVSLTHTRQAMGTPHYMAPEQWEKPTEVDHRADIYALGVVIYELLTGELPLGRFDPPSVKAHLDGRIDEIVLRLLAKEPDRRYQHASDVRTALFHYAQAVVPVVRATKQGRSKKGFYEYRSETEFFGWPLVHIVSGIDPRTGTKRIAKGWIALGDVMAIGVLALSGVFSVGVFAVAGVLGVGLLALAGALAAGGVSVGGTALGFFSLGGVALGWLAVGGVAVGKFAIGGAAVGDHVHKRGGDSKFWEELRDDLTDLFNG